METRMSSAGLVLSLIYLVFVQCAAAETSNDAVVRSLEDSPIRNYLRHFHDNQIYIPRIPTNEILAKRAAIPFSGGIYGKRSALPFNGGMYGKRSHSDSTLDDLLNDHVSVEIRAMPMNGGFFG